MKRMEDPNHELVERARVGDAEAFRVLVESHSRPIFRVVFRILGNEDLAEDVVQESFLKAYRSLPGFDRRSQFWSWLYRIAVNCAYDAMRRERRRGPHTDLAADPGFDTLASEAPSADRLAASGDIRRAVGRELAAMSPRERAAFVLRHFEGRSILEIGELLGMREGAVKQAVFRAVGKLRKALAPVIEENHEPAV
jgi:RNA polymerase sigma-70 factor (ECF subfamily)